MKEYFIEPELRSDASLMRLIDATKPVLGSALGTSAGLVTAKWRRFDEQGS